MFRMSKLSEKTTIYLEPSVKKSVQYYAVRDDKSLSKIINDRLSEYLETQEDIANAEKARCDGDQIVSFEEVLNDLGIDINALQDRAKVEG